MLSDKRCLSTVHTMNHEDFMVDATSMVDALVVYIIQLKELNKLDFTVLLFYNNV